MNAKMTYELSVRIQAENRMELLRAFAYLGLREQGYVFRGPHIATAPRPLPSHENMRYAKPFFALANMKPLVLAVAEENPPIVKNFGEHTETEPDELFSIWAIRDLSLGDIAPDRPAAFALIAALLEWLAEFRLPSSFLECALSLLVAVLESPRENPVWIAAKTPPDRFHSSLSRFVDWNAAPKVPELHPWMLRSRTLSEYERECLQAIRDYLDATAAWLKHNGLEERRALPNLERDCFWAAWRLVDNLTDKEILSRHEDVFKIEGRFLGDDATVRKALNQLSSTLGLNLKKRKQNKMFVS